MPAWNGNGLLQRNHEIGMFVWDQKIDISLISETHLTRKSCPKIKGYKIYRTIWQKKIGEGRSAVLIKENRKHYEEDNLETKQMQVTTVCIQTKPVNIIVVTIYCLSWFKLEKEDFMWLFQKLGNCFIIGDDYIAKSTFWGSRLDVPIDKELYKTIKELKCEVQSTGYWQLVQSKASWLDWLLCNERNSWLLPAILA